MLHLARRFETVYRDEALKQHEDESGSSEADENRAENHSLSIGNRGQRIPG